MQVEGRQIVVLAVLCCASSVVEDALSVNCNKISIAAEV
jgi:hypothetical protein